MKRHAKICNLLLTLVITSYAVQAGDFDLSWSTLDSGGAARITGPGWELSGTLGQPDANAIPLTGYSYALYGGFWWGATPRTVSPGDTNCDGLINAGDIDPFILALVEPSGYAAQYPDCDILSADTNGDGLINAGDIDPFVALLVGP